LLDQKNNVTPTIVQGANGYQSSIIETLSS